jgi:ribosomal protein S18 acetylase RimI-like enzyme
MSGIFTDGFYNWLRLFSRDKQKLSPAFAHMFDLDVFYLAIQDGNIVAIAACADNTHTAVHLGKNELKQYLGFIMGSFAYRVLKKEFEDKGYPFEIGADTGSVEFVATAMDYKRQGAAYAVIEHILSVGYADYVLEVEDNNIAAIKLYTKLGFAECHRVKDRIYMRRGK